MSLRLALALLVASAAALPGQLIRTWGSADAAGVVKLWEAGFRRHHPGIRFETTLAGNDSAIGGIYARAADLAILSREARPIEIDAFQQVFEHPPREVPVMTNTSGLSVLVHKDNPLSKLSLAQLDGIFGAEHRRGSKTIATWGQLGLTGEWAGKPIGLYSLKIASDFSYFFEQAVLAGSRRWNCHLREFADGPRLIEALAKDPYGVAVVERPEPHAYVKKVALVETPPARTVSVFLNHPGPILDEYLRYILSPEGQQAIRRDGHYLPLAEKPPQPDYLGDLAPYHPLQQVSGAIRNCGNNYILALMKLWEDGFQKAQPRIRFETNLRGTETGVAGVYGNAADLGFVGREIYDIEDRAFQERFHYQPTVIQISSGSYATMHKTFSLMVFVNKANPLSGMTMTQLDAVYGCERRRGAQEPVRTWGQLGLTGEWAAKPVHVYGYNLDTGMANFFRLAVLLNSSQWNGEMKDFDNGRDAKGGVINAGVYILEALAQDPYGIAYANVLFANPDVKTVALAAAAGGEFIEPTIENVWRRAYPITRYTNVVINRPAGRPVEPKIKEFIRYILSRDGMEAVVRDGSYLPLTRELILRELAKLD
jgi:phosphate transport system substrate-binding protein